MATLVCRVCLVGNTRMLHVVNIHLLAIYEKLTDTKLHTDLENGMPSTVCYVCHRQLQKCQRFSHMAHKSNIIFQDQLLNGTKLKQDMQSPGINYLTVSPTKHIDLDPYLGSIKTELVVVEETSEIAETEIVEMKLETGDIKMVQNNTKLVENNDEYCKVTHNMDNMLSQGMPKLSINSTKYIPIYIDSDTGSTTDTIKEEQIVVDETDAEDIDIEEMKLEMHEEDTEIKSTVKLNKEVQVIVKVEEIDETKEIDIEIFKDVEVDMLNNKELSKNDLKLKHNNVLFCGKCNKKNSSKCQLKRHLKFHRREKPFICNICDKTFTHKRTLTNHMLVHGERSYSCDRCEKMFTSKSNLSKHILLHTGERPYSCNRCFKTFALNSNLAKHMLVHTGEKPYTCNSCDRAFTSKSNLSRHILLHTGVKPYSCDRCDKAFNQKSTLTKHLLGHNGKKSYACNRCVKAFTHKSTLTNHMLVHTGVKPYSCNKCVKVFSYKSQLASHILVHTGEKPYTCKRCDKAFTHKGTLSNHMLVHTGERPYVCHICHKAFTHKNNLAKHILIHTGEKPYSCDRCDKAFAQKSTLTKHYASSH